MGPLDQTPHTRMARDAAETESGERCCKVAMLAERRALPELDAELVRRRTEADASLRDLAAYVNERLTTRALSEADVELTADPGTVRSVVASDANDDLDVATRERITTTLDRSDLDVPALRRSFVSHETVRRHLREHLEVDTARTTASRSVEDTREMIAAIVDRDASIVEQALAGLRRDGKLEGGCLDAAMTVRVTCEECGRTHTVDELLDAGGCACGSE